MDEKDQNIALLSKRLGELTVENERLKETLAKTRTLCVEADAASSRALRAVLFES